MNFNRMLKTAGLTKTDAAVLFGVSRQTIHGWCEGTGPRGTPRAGSYTERMRTTIMKEVIKLMGGKRLPFTVLIKSKRDKAVKALALKLQSLPPAK